MPRDGSTASAHVSSISVDGRLIDLVGGALSKFEQYNAEFIASVVRKMFNYETFSQVANQLDIVGYVLGTVDDWSRTPQGAALLGWFANYINESFAVEIANENANRNRLSIPPFSTGDVTAAVAKSFCEAVASKIAENPRYVNHLRFVTYYAEGDSRDRLAVLLASVEQAFSKLTATNRTREETEAYDKIKRLNDFDQVESDRTAARKTMNLCKAHLIGQNLEGTTVLPEFMNQCLNKAGPFYQKPYSEANLSQESQRVQKRYTQDVLNRGVQASPLLKQHLAEPLRYVKKSDEECREGYIATNDTTCTTKISADGYETLGKLYVEACFKMHGCAANNLKGLNAVKQALCEAECLPKTMIDQDGKVSTEPSNVDVLVRAFDSIDLPVTDATRTIRTDTDNKAIEYASRGMRHVPRSQKTLEDECVANCQEVGGSACREQCETDPYKINVKCPESRFGKILSETECVEKETNPAEIRSLKIRDNSKTYGLATAAALGSTPYGIGLGAAAYGVGRLARPAKNAIENLKRGTSAGIEFVRNRKANLFRGGENMSDEHNDEGIHPAIT
jgi:hypothetical protein